MSRFTYSGGLREKTRFEGHGFSRAVARTELGGFSRWLSELSDRIEEKRFEVAQRIFFRWRRTSGLKTRATAVGQWRVLQ